VADLEPAPPPPLWATNCMHDAVTHGTYDMWQRCCTMATPSPVYLFKRVKHMVLRICKMIAT